MSNFANYLFQYMIDDHYDYEVPSLISPKLVY